VRLQGGASRNAAERAARKIRCRSCFSEFDALDFADNAAAWFRHCGYGIQN